MTTLFQKGLVFAVIVLFIGAGFVPSISSDNEIKPIIKNNYTKADGTASKTKNNNGSLSGYVTDTSMNPIEGARVRVYFHETYEENYTDASGYYNVTNISICYCMKNATASKNGYTTEWILLSIVENTTHDFILSPLFDVYVDEDADPVWYDATHVKTIQEGIDNATAGDTVYVYNGTYFENVIVNKSIDLIGEDRNTTIIDGGGIGDVVYISANGVVLSGFMVQNSGHSGAPNDDSGIDIRLDFVSINNCNFYNNEISIYLNSSSSNNSISNCFIDGNYNSIWLDASNNNSITDNIVSFNNMGIMVDYCENNIIKNNQCLNNTNVGLRLFYASFNIVDDNTLSGNGYDGIRFISANENQISGNKISSNSVGIRIRISSNNNHISNCNISDNMDDGIYLEGSISNIINENFIWRNADGIVILTSGDDNYILNNNISNNGFGLLLYYADENTISGNRISSNADDSICIINSNFNSFSENNIMYNKLNNNKGVDIHSPSNNNNFFHNNFIENNINAKDEGLNNWNDGYPSGGNYWDDYTGTDSDGDGIGDIPYDISGGDNQDLYPFIEENGWLKTIEVNQDGWARGFPIRHALDGDWAGAQSFKTSNDTLTRVDVYLRRFGNPEFNLTLEVREDSPDGTLIESFEYQPDDVDVNWGWFNLDLIDINTTPSTDYFIVCPPAPSGVTTSFGYEWGYAFGNQYDDGAFWFTRDGGGLWRDLPTMYEFVFRTYGYS